MPEIQHHIVKMELEFHVHGTLPIGVAVDAIGTALALIPDLDLPLDPVEAEAAKAYDFASTISKPKVGQIIITRR